jgi:hypothetical protein
VKPERAARARRAPRAAVLTTAFGERRRLSEGTFVQASVRARLLGIPLLRLDAAVVLVPAAITSSPSVPIRSEDGLAAAVRSINDGAEVLAQVRRNDGR